MLVACPRLRFTCPNGTQFGGCEQDRGRQGTTSLAIALAVSDRLPARVSMAPRREAARSFTRRAEQCGRVRDHVLVMILRSGLMYQS